MGILIHLFKDSYTVNFVRTQLCRDEVREFAQCSKDNGFSMVVK